MAHGGHHLSCKRDGRGPQAVAPRLPDRGRGDGGDTGAWGSV